MIAAAAVAAVVAGVGRIPEPVPPGAASSLPPPLALCSTTPSRDSVCVWGVQGGVTTTSITAPTKYTAAIQQALAIPPSMATALAAAGGGGAGGGGGEEGTVAVEAAAQRVLQQHVLVRMRVISFRVLSFRRPLIYIYIILYITLHIY
jgi:hypothetical protein